MELDVCIYSVSHTGQDLGVSYAWDQVNPAAVSRQEGEVDLPRTRMENEALEVSQTGCVCVCVEIGNG